MAYKRARIKVVPQSFYKVQTEKHPTGYVMTSTGLMRGRVVKKSGMGDKTRVIRLTRPVDINNDRKIDDRDLRPGQIIGRVGRNQPSPKSVKVRTHMRGGRLVSGYRKRN
jgi:hypothetical protein